MLDKLTAFLLDLVQKAFAAAWSFLVDFVVAVFDLVFGVIVTLLSAIPLPDFVVGGLAAVWGSMPPGLLYVLSAIGIPQAFALFGAAYAFRLGRKIVTLFQW